jgi:hypothetical protein
VFDSVLPDQASSDSVLSLLELLAVRLEQDVRPGEPEQSCRASRLAVAAGWWLPLRQAVYGFAGTAQLAPSQQMLEAAQPLLLPFGHPRLGPFRLLSSSFVASNFSLHARPVPVDPPSSWSLRFLFPRAAGSSSIFTFAVGSQPVVCAALPADTERWNTSECFAPVVINASHVSCVCRFVSSSFYAALPLAQLLTGASSAQLLPNPSDTSGAVVPLVPTLPAGLAIAAVLVLAIAGLWAIAARRGRADVAPSTFVSTGVLPSDVVPADNRIRVPNHPVASQHNGVSVLSAAVATRAAQQQGEDAIGAILARKDENIWVSDEEQFENVGDPLLSEDVARSIDSDGFHDANARLWD